MREIFSCVISFCMGTFSFLGFQSMFLNFINNDMRCEEESNIQSWLIKEQKHIVDDYQAVAKLQDDSSGFQVKRYIIQMYSQYNVVGDHPMIPEEAFLFVPKRQTDPNIHKDDFKIGQGKNIRRLLFEGWAQETYTPYQLEHLKELDDYIARKGLQFDSRWDKSWRMRWLLSTGCNVKKAVEDMKIFTEYQARVKELTFTNNISKFLSKGIFYVAGRDCHYRPIFVFDVDKIIKLDMTEDEILETQTYFFEYVLRNMLIPGQVENWVVILDAAQVGLFSLVGSMKKSFTFLSDTYRSRMFVCYVVRIPSSISFLWGIVKRFLEEETVRKINFFDESVVEPLFQYCNPSQVEVRFGGTLPNLEEGQYWPPREVSSHYKCERDPVKMLTKEEYTQNYNKKVIYDTRIHEQNIIKPKTKNDLKQNQQAHTIRKIERELKRLIDTVVQEKTEMKAVPCIIKPLSYKDLAEMSKQKKEKEEKQKKQMEAKVKK